MHLHHRLQAITAFPATISVEHLDSVLQQFITICVEEEESLHANKGWQVAIDILLQSTIWSIYADSLRTKSFGVAQTSVDPHVLLVVDRILLADGRSEPKQFKSPSFLNLMPLLVESLYDTPLQNTSGHKSIEDHLHLVMASLLFAGCRAQRLPMQVLACFREIWIVRILGLVETCDDNDELSFELTKLLLALNEQYMSIDGPNLFALAFEAQLIHQTFCGNLIFLLNRAHNTNNDDLCLSLLILKMLFLLFAKPSTAQAFYLNDLKVLVDVFLRELIDLADDAEPLRHTYLRVLPSLLTKTELHESTYKPLAIKYTLESLISNSDVREISETTRRLVKRALDVDVIRQVAPKPLAKFQYEPKWSSSIDLTTRSMNAQTIEPTPCQQSAITDLADQHGESSGRSRAMSSLDRPSSALSNRGRTAPAPPPRPVSSLSISALSPLLSTPRRMPPPIPSIDR